MRAARVMLAASVVGLIGAAILFTRKAAAAENMSDYETLFKKWAAIYQTDWRLLMAHALAESNLDSAAVNKSDPSYGLMQVLCQHKGTGICTNVFNVDGWAGMTAGRLMDPDTNIRIGAQIIAYNVRTFGMPRAVAVYNAWDQRKAPQAGPFKNQSYVNKVLANYARLQGR